MDGVGMDGFGVDGFGVNGFTVRPEQWGPWIRRFLPAAEPFFFTDGDLAEQLSAAGEVVYTRDELRDSFPRFRLDHGTAYRMGAVDSASFVWLAGREARGRIAPPLWAAIRDAQGGNGRGQVYGESWPLPPIEAPAADRLPDGRYLLAPDTWLAQDQRVQHRWLREWMSHRLVEDEMHPVDAPVAPDLRELVGRYANTFADASGANCFSTALGLALRRPDEIFPLWLHPEPFLRALRGNGFRPADGAEPRPGDVVVWAETAGRPVHAGFCVGAGLVFHKPGQSWEEPYAIVTLDDLCGYYGTATGGGSMTVHRRE